MERAELLSENGKIFTVQGKALNEHAAADVKVLVVGNPANTNCLIAMNNAPDIPRERFTSMMRLDHNRAVAQLAAKLGVPVTRRSPKWAYGATTRRRCTPTCSTRRCGGEQAAGAVDDQAWIENEFLPNVGKRGAAIIEARGASSAASAASAAIDHVRDWVSGTDGDWVSMGVPSDGSYGIPEGLICGFPCTCAGGEYDDRPGPRHRRVLTRQDRRLRGRADQRARHGRRAGPDLAARGGLPRPAVASATARVCSRVASNERDQASVSAT